MRDRSVYLLIALSILVIAGAVYFGVSVASELAAINAP